VLIEDVKKERFATGRKARQAPTEDTGESCSRHIPDAISAGRTISTPRSRCTVARSWSERAHRSTRPQLLPGLLQVDVTRCVPPRGEFGPIAHRTSNSLESLRSDLARTHSPLLVLSRCSPSRGSDDASAALSAAA